MNAIKEIRTERKLTQQAIADCLGVSRPLVAFWEKGGWPAAKAIPGIASALGVSIQQLYDLSSDVDSKATGGEAP